MKRFYLFLSLILLFSLAGNIVLLFVIPWDSDKKMEGSQAFDENENNNISLFNRPESIEYETIQYDTYSLDGTPVLFLNFSLHGTITDSIARKYHTNVSSQLIRNIQNIVYFFSDFKLKFRKNDRISLFYRPQDGKILYMRYKNRSRRAISEAFLFEDEAGERYFTSEGSYLVPCLVNGPFDGCPNARLVRDRFGLVPVFSLPPQSPIYLPFKAKIMNISTSRKQGGEVEITYSNFLKKAWFKGLATIETNLKKEELYSQNSVIGRGGYRKEKRGQDGVTYYLLNKDGSLNSPFLFHHTSQKQISEQFKNNFDISVRYYQRLYKRGYRFEKVFFVK
ncbi:hypothetical protein KAH37_07360 [bacterium]|nr:hypothetical protein [bacterium]